MVKKKISEEKSNGKEIKKKKVDAKKKNSLQPEVNIGLVGHVDHGKTTLTQRLTGKWTDTHSEELKRGITIRLGYADAIFYKDSKGKFTANPKGKATELRKVSFIDAPGHESLMATMLAGSTLMDGALLLVSATEKCPQPQTREHIMALEISGIKNVVVVQNKIDLVSEEDAIKNFHEIKEFLSTTSYSDAPIIPISARAGANIDILIKTIEEVIPTPKRDPKATPMMLVARSFDINKPGTKIKSIVGGVLGGALKQGVLKVGDDIELRPGRMVEERNQKVYKPIFTKIVGLKTGGVEVEEVGPGGSIAALTSLDPTVVKSDSFAGSVVGYVGKLPPVWHELTMKVILLERVVGAKEEIEVKPLAKGEILMLNVNSAATVGVVSNMSKGKVYCKLKKPVCADAGSRITVSRRVGNRFRLIGYGIIE